MDTLYRIMSGAPISPREVRWAAAFVMLWFLVDMFWFIGTLNHWFGL